MPLGSVQPPVAQHWASPRESGQFPTSVKEVVTLLVKSKTRGKAVLHTMFEGQRNRVHSPGEAYSHGVGDLLSRLNQQSLSS
jgi:hypothetical protein